MSLFQYGDFTLHSLTKSKWTIDCGDLTVFDTRTLAYMAATYLLPRFGGVRGVPEGGLLFASALSQYAYPPGPWLIADDVLTTGQSMEEFRKTLDTVNGPILGVVMFARGRCPDWVKAICQLPEDLWK